MKYIDGYEALKRMCWGHDSYQIAFHLVEVDGIWKGKDIERAAGRIRACLSRSKPEFFHLSEIIAITRLTRQYDAVWFICDELGLSRPHPLDVAEQVEHLRASIDAAARRLESASESLERIAGMEAAPPPVLPVEPAAQFRREALH